MTLDHAIVVDDLAADRRLADRVLQYAGWTVAVARNSGESRDLIERAIKESVSECTVIITDLNMPNDPLTDRSTHQASAGSRFALRLRTQMEQGIIPRMPIVALTALTERDIHMTALAFGCDAVLTKPATRDLAQRIQAALVQAQQEDAEIVGAHALMHLLRCRLAEAVLPSAPGKAPLSEQDITRALLAYHRQGVVGLGQSALAACLAPAAASVLQCGEIVYQQLIAYVDKIVRLGLHESVALLSGELRDHLTPAEQCATLGISLSEYYCRRRDAVAVLLELVMQRSS
jgi:CheY-like chemotaxis protein